MAGFEVVGAKAWRMSAGRSRYPSRRWGRFQAQISEHMVLLESLLGDQGFQGATKELVVPLGSGSPNVDQQVSPGHDGCEAGVGEACGEGPRLFAAS